MSKNHVETYKNLTNQMQNLGGMIPNVMGGFGALHEGATKTGALDQRTKELIALGIAITVRCDGCIAFHVHDALKAGAAEAEIAETVGVAIMMGGGPSVVYGVEAIEALEQFKKESTIS